MSCSLVGYFWEEDFLGGGSAVRAFLHVHIVEGLAVRAFDSGHFIEVSINYLHPLFLQFLFALEFCGLEYEQECNYC